MRIGTAEDAPTHKRIHPSMDGPITADRAALRKQMRDARRGLPPRERLAAAEAVADHLRALLPAFSQTGKIAGYWACDGELPLHPLLTGKFPFTYLLPRVRAGKQLDFVSWRPGDGVTTNRFGIPEPAAGEAIEASLIDVILLPLLAFDRHGHRLGSGGGYYDRTLAFSTGAPRASRPLLVGVGYALQELSELHTEAWDVPLDYVVTERGVLERATCA